MKRYWIYQYILLHCAAFIMCESYYTIIAPGFMKSNRNYTVAVSLHDSNEPCVIKVSIDGISFKVTEQVYMRPFETKNIEFFPPRLSRGDYKLIAEGLSGCYFKNESKIYVDDLNGPKIYVQTDKAIYKPQDLVQFRVVILDEHTRPVRIAEPIRVEIFDGADNRVKQFKDITLVKGVYTNKFQLSQQPVLGSWKIRVIISGKYAYSNQKTITVQKYVLPKFSVFIKTPTNVDIASGSIKAVVYGKYTFDKYVEGSITAELLNLDTVLQQRKLEVESLGHVTFDLQNSKEFEALEFVTLKVSLTEKLTGITQHESTRINLYNFSYFILMYGEEVEFKNNIPIRLKAHVKTLNGVVVTDRETPMYLIHGGFVYRSYLDENAVATFDYTNDPNDVYVFEFGDSQSKFPNIFTNNNLALNDTEYYCRLKLADTRIRLGKTLDIEVSSIANIPYLVYTIVGHGSLVRMEHVSVPPNRKSFTIQITPSVEMIPVSFIYVHYVQNGNLRYEEMKLTFPNELENQISVVAPAQVGPGQEVTLTLKAQPTSYVSILAVDLSVCLLDCSYDIYKDKIIKDLNKDRTFSPISALVYPGLTSGLLTLTNAHYPFTSLSGVGIVESANYVPPVFRTKFPETWIFENYLINDTITELTFNIPETITTWRITAFSNNDYTGFGLMDVATNITTIQPFFISLNLPYSVKRGEIVNIPVTIFNYLNQSVDTKVIMFNFDEEFHFVEYTDEGEKKSLDNHYQTKFINIPSDSGKTVKFLINPQKVGELELSVTATNSLYSDAIQQKLRVESDGVSKYHNIASYLSVPDGEKLTSSFSFEIPQDIVPDSEYITLSVGGDFVVPSLDNLNDLVKMPTGCGEQNMVNFAPNILILQYLKATGTFSKAKDLVTKIKSFIDIGYQQELSFRHKNGGYSVFGEVYDFEAGTWLTAYVIRFFIKASKYSSIEPRIIESGLQYLSTQQNKNGEFNFTGYLFDSAHQTKYGHTAFVLMTFLEDRKYARKFNTNIQKGLKFLNSNLNDVDDIYSLAIIATTLKMARHENAQRVIDKLKLYSNEDKNGLMWWSENDRNPGKDVEITAYVLMALLDTPGDHLPILKWLIEQRNAEGGFKSTHDTVVGLQALVKFSEKYNNFKDLDLKITYSAQEPNGREVKYDEFNVQPDNVLILQKHELPKTTRHVEYELSGSGHALLQLSYQYNVNQQPQIQHFLIEPKASLPNSNEMDLEICFTYQSKFASPNKTTNMVIMEANLPSGYRSDAESSSSLIDNDLVQRIESKNAESTIVLYFDNLSADINHCLNIAADKTNEVVELKPAAIKMYDYYNLSRSNTEFYNIKE